MFIHRIDRSPEPLPNTAFTGVSLFKKSLLRGIRLAMYIVGQERRLVDPPSQVVAGVRTVTTKMDERCDAHVAALIRFFRFVISSQNRFGRKQKPATNVPHSNQKSARSSHSF